MSGDRAKTIDDLFECIIKSLNDTKNIQTDMKKLWFGNLKDGGCKNICDFLFDGTIINSNVKYYTDIEDILQREIEKQKQEMKKKDTIIDARNARIRELDELISNIINSKGWQTLEKLRKIKKTILNFNS